MLLNKTVLIIEDNAFDMKLFIDVLKTQGYTAVRAFNAEGGLALARDRRPDVIILNIELRANSGRDALAALKADPATRDIPVIAARAGGGRADMGPGPGADAFVPKPVCVPELLRTVGGLLEAAPRTSACSG